MDEKISSRIAGNTMAYIGGNLFSRLFDVLTILILARYLGVGDFGKFSFAFAYVGIFSVLIDWGVNFILVRETSRNAGNHSFLLGNGVSLKFFLTLIVIVLVCVSIFVLPFPSDQKLLVAIVSLNLLISFRLPSFKDVFEVPLISRLKLKYSAYAAILNRVLTFAAIVVALFFRAPLWVIVVVYTLISLPAFFLLLSFSLKLIKPALQIKWESWKYLLREGFPLGLSGIFFIFISQFDMFLLSQFWSVKEIGLYSASRRLTEPLELIPNALTFSILPVMSQLWSEGKLRVARIYEKSLLYLLLIAAPLTGLLASLARPIISLLFGKNFLAAEKSLLFLSFYLPFIFAWHISGSVFVAINKQKISSLIWLAALILNLVLNLFLIPANSFVGASLARLLTGIFVALASLYFVFRYIGKINFKFMVKILVLTVPLLIVLKFWLPLSPLLSFLVFSGGYAAGIIFLKILGPEDKEFLRKNILARLTR